VRANDFNCYNDDHPAFVIKPPMTMCQARGVSVYTDSGECRNMLRLRNLRGRIVFAVKLLHGAGYVKPTPTRDSPSHYTWWPFAGYDVLANSEELVG
jgi:hypothetical protein